MTNSQTLLGALKESLKWAHTSAAYRAERWGRAEEDDFIRRANELISAYESRSQSGATEKHWPFVESPSAFTERLGDALKVHITPLAAVRSVLIENPPTISNEYLRRTTPTPPVSEEYLREVFFQALMRRQPRVDFNDVLPPVTIEQVNNALTEVFRVSQPPADGRDDGWRPIETAPDSGAILVHYDSDEIVLLEGDGDGYEWKPYDGVNESAKGISKPTHWRPLPAPPNTTDTVLAEAGGLK